MDLHWMMIRVPSRAFGAAAALSVLGCAAPRPAERSERPAEHPAADSTPSAAPLAGTTVYVCSDGVRFSVRAVGDSAVVTLPERTATLPHVEAGSGARYAAGGVVFWSKGEEARLEIGGARHTGCAGRAAGEGDSRVAGSTGCNSFSGTVERNGDRLAFGRMVTTLMACADTAISSQEQRFLQMLVTVDRGATVGDRLTLYAKGRPVARFVAVCFQ